MNYAKFLLAFAAAMASPAASALEADMTIAVEESPTAAAATLTAMAADELGEHGEAVHRRSFHRAPDGLFYIHAAANGTPLRFVVDTGATVVVLNRNDAARLGLSYESLDRSARMNTVGGPSAMKWTEIERLEMAGKKLEGIAAAVVDQGLPVSLLGQNALSLLGTVTLKGNVLTIE
jgi:aspartyl protease family protein